MINDDQHPIGPDDDPAATTPEVALDRAHVIAHAAGDNLDHIDTTTEQLVTRKPVDAAARRGAR